MNEFRFKQYTLYVLRECSPITSSKEYHLFLEALATDTDKTQNRNGEKVACLYDVLS
jgi:hypothetical protein